MNKDLKVGQAIEMIKLRVKPENIIAFLEGRKTVDAFASSLKGYVGTEIVRINESDFYMLIRWDSLEAVEEVQKVTNTATVISDWLTATAEFISFDTTTVVYEN